jgi:ABC-type antimicrobial peptide transport system permease subunit
MHDSVRKVIVELFQLAAGILIFSGLLSVILFVFQETFLIGLLRTFDPTIISLVIFLVAILVSISAVSLVYRYIFRLSPERAY